MKMTCPLFIGGKASAWPEPLAVIRPRPRKCLDCGPVYAGRHCPLLSRRRVASVWPRHLALLITGGKPPFKTH
eukprot:CAMPEP_0177215486 /NCGR_PEP_ID=MMETSP0367-20130122/34245_1 /TAXON_ID=447022 ORGANISM="Scrippsiella hangoei-like, Strain SHHI-4" /NCGR_SAMPLE_ID=MMETSP0367 /ASSEMBLY_ACC=CAM_ASM_000362 /LENGTH=72 /DNA_ID=CAMNT_0018664929 /DNA_START=1 /DNA_END=216 /DNA_ORIENTATION=+